MMFVRQATSDAPTLEAVSCIGYFAETNACFQTYNFVWSFFVMILNCETTSSVECGVVGADIQVLISATPRFECLKTYESEPNTR